MTMRKFALLFLLSALWFLIGAAPAAKKPGRAPKVAVSVSLGKTAVWVGDVIPYTVRAIHDRDVEFALDHLKKENLVLAPFVLRDIAIAEGDWSPDKKLLEITLLLTTYEIGKSELTIPPLHLYYFVREAGIGRKESQAETIQVPATRVGLRSTLTGGPSRPRDDKAARAVDGMRIGAVFVLGIAGLSFAGARVARWAWKSAHAPKAKRRPFARHARDKLVNEGLARIRALGGSTDEELTRYYQEVAAFVHRYVQGSLDIDASCLTPEEIDAALRRAGANGAFVQGIRNLMERCDTVRYARDGLRLAREGHGEIQAAFEETAAAMRRALVR
jgi:hypothetical protein